MMAYLGIEYCQRKKIMHDAHAGIDFIFRKTTNTTSTILFSEL